MASRELVVGIDAGIAHMSIFAAYRDEITKPIMWSVERICPPASKYAWEDAHGGAMLFCEKYKALLDEAECIALEQQMRDQFTVINATIATLYPRKYHRCHPHTIGAAFKLPRRREAKKKASIAYVSNRVGEAWPADAKKQDDLADSALLAFYVHHFLLDPLTT